jgi:hypothetical protein
MIFFASKELDIAEADQTIFLNCHRRKRSENAPVLVTFADPRQKASWICKGKLLKNSQPKRALTQDITPAVHALRNDVFKQKKILSPIQQSLFQLRYLRTWTFVQMKAQSGHTITPRNSKSEVATKLPGHRSPINDSQI